MIKQFTTLGVAIVLLSAVPASAETPADFLRQFAAEAKQADSAFTGFSSERGARFFITRHANDWSCASCHSQDPRQSGEHIRTGKTIDALAPGINPERFTSARQVSKWYRRNCKDVLARECSALEKGDVLSYLLALKP